MSLKTSKRIMSVQQDLMEETDSTVAPEVTEPVVLTEAEKRKEEKRKAKEKKRKKKPSIFEFVAFTPGQMKRKCEKYGVTWSSKNLVIPLGAVVLVSAIFSYIFDFDIPYVIATLLIGLFFTPVIMNTQNRFEYERRRFGNVNIYMQQFAQGMIKKARVIAAMEDTLIAFPDGEMKEDVEKAIDILATSEDVREGEKKAFAYIEKKYGNRQLSTLHDFALKIEDRGGSYVYELSLLDELRIKWKERVDNYQKELGMTTMFCVFEYVLMIIICGFIMSNMPEMMNISGKALTQVTEVLAIGIAYIFLFCLQRKKCQNWIEIDEPMEEEEANRALDYVENFNPKENGRLGFKLGMMWLIAASVLILLTRDVPIAVFCIFFEIFLLNMHNIICEMYKREIKNEIKKCYPKWLFDICLLIQKENVANSITKSINDAPPILRRELTSLSDKLMENPTSAELLINFLKNYNIPGVRETMSMLVSLDNGGITNNRLQMEKLVEENMSMIDKEDELAARTKTATLARYYYYPMFPCMMLLGVYFIEMLIEIFINIAGVLGV